MATSLPVGGNSYHWITVHPDLDPVRADLAQALRAAVVGSIPSSPDQLDLASIRNPSGDTISVVLVRLRSRGEGQQDLDAGYAFSHICPVDADIPGKLYRLTATPTEP